MFHAIVWRVEITLPLLLRLFFSKSLSFFFFFFSLPGWHPLVVLSGRDNCAVVPSLCSVCVCVCVNMRVGGSEIVWFWLDFLFHCWLGVPGFFILVLSIQKSYDVCELKEFGFI